MSAFESMSMSLFVRPLAALLLAGAGLPFGPARAGTITNCTGAALLAEIQSGGTVIFGCSGVITVAGPISITNAVALDATGRDVELVPTGNAGVFHVAARGALALTKIVIRSGSSTNGGAIFNRGTVRLISCQLSENVAIGESGADGRASDDGGLNGGDGHNGGSGRPAAGGAVYNLGYFSALESGFFNNRAIAGDGGVGGNGHVGELTGGDGGKGGNGGAAHGGAIYNGGIVALIRCSFDANAVQAGDGAEGGDFGAAQYPGNVGRGGRGGQAGGGAIYAARKTTNSITGCTFSGNSAQGGNSAAGGSSHRSGMPGEAGGPVFGGGVASYGTAIILNSTFFENQVQGGNGGDGANAELRGGAGGNGGNAWGGNLFNAGKSQVTHCTIYGGAALGGTNGVAGSGTFDGDNGKIGSSRGSNVGSSDGRVTLGHTIMANSASTSSFLTNVTVTWTTNIIEDVESGRSNATEIICVSVTTTREGGPVLRYDLNCETNDITGTNLIARTTVTSTTNRNRITFTDNRANAYGAFKDAGYNLLSDRSIKFKPSTKGGTSLTEVDPLLGPLADNGGPTETMELLEGSPAIDRGSGEPVLENDQRGAARPGGDYSPRADIGAYESDAAIVGPVFIVTQPVSNTVRAGSNATFLVVANGTPPFSYQWYRSPAVALDDETSMSLTFTPASLADAGGYFVVVENASGSVTSVVATLTVNQAPMTESEPADYQAFPGEHVSFAFGVTAHPAAAFRWFFNGTNLISGATNSVLIRTNVQSANVGNYHAVATNLFGSVTSRVARLTIGTNPLVIISQPVDVTAFAGGSATFSFPTTGNPAASYRWFHGTNFTLFAGPTTNSTLFITNVQSALAGTYVAIATNLLGSVTSRVATLTVITLPILTQPLPSTTNVAAGETLTLAASVDGPGPITFQWHFTDQSFNTPPIAGATNATLTLPNFQAANEGTYTLEAINGFGSVSFDGVAVTLATGGSPSPSPAKHD